MKSRLITWSGVILLAYGAYVVGQQGAIETPKSDGPFMVTGTGESNILLDTKTGRTWLLSELPQSPLPVWLPLGRVDSAEEALRVLAEADEWRRSKPREEWESDVRRRYTSDLAERLIQQRRQAAK